MAQNLESKPGVALGIVYTPFLPGGHYLEMLVARLASRLTPRCAHVFDAAMDALALLDEIQGFKVAVLAGYSSEARDNEVVIREYVLPTREYSEPARLLAALKPGLEGSLELDSLVSSLDALAYSLGRRVAVIVVGCKSHSCKMVADILEAIVLGLCDNLASEDKRQEEH